MLKSLSLLLALGAAASATAVVLVTSAGDPASVQTARAQASPAAMAEPRAGAARRPGMP